MSIKMKTQVVGLKELEGALKELGKAAGQKGGPVKTALFAAALPVLRAAQANVPVADGDLKRAIKRTRLKNPLAYNEVITIGFPMPQWASGKHAVLTNKKQGGHGLFVEFGTGLPRTGTRKQNTPFSGEFMEARPFLRPALESNRQISTNIFRTKLAVGIEKIAKEIGNKNAAKVAAQVKTFS